ncbi:MAG: prepilin-type N-terminal cleavage/methylation domain-containing protein [Phycisphaeraceae bacterium]|nr:prepilin-type N-terminal cleavage/methylation domain-containing protein [Phycisphaeraceae bacterium]
MNCKLATRKTDGFTLIELLVVISIIALLISILLPALRKARDSGRFSVCASNQRSIVTAAIAYAVDEDGQFPISIVRRTTGIPYSFPSYIYYNSASYYPVHRLSDLLLAYLPTSVVLMCPLGGGSETTIQSALKGTYEDKILNSTYRSSYNLLWNYSYWDERVIPGYGALGTFIAPQKLEDTNDDLLTNDAIWLRLGVYWAPHMPPGRNAFVAANDTMYQGYDNMPPDFAFNGGYRDGHVESVAFRDHTLNALATSGVSLYLPQTKGIIPH